MTASYLDSKRITGAAADIAVTQGGWVELGRTTLGSTGDTISVASLADKRYYMVLTNLLSTGSVNGGIRFNNDSGSNYAKRTNYNGGTDGTGINKTETYIQNSSVTNSLGVSYVSNLSSKEKLKISHSVDSSTAGAATSPARDETVGKWSNTSNAIDRMDIINTDTGDYGIGSECVVLGWDPADTHTSNFWEELGTDTGNGSDGTLDIAFTAKKYLWGQAWLKSSSASGDLVIRMGNDTIETTDVYASRQSENGGGDTTFTTHNSILCTPRTEDEFFINFFVINNASNEKLVTGHVVSNTTAGAGTAPQRGEIVGKYVNTSTQANQIRLTVDVGNLTTASYFKLWGSD